MDILYQDPHFVAVYKPAGLLVHRSAIDRHETRFAMQMTRDAIGRSVYPVHRLDKPTAGILVFALSRAMATALTRHFTDGKVRKRYLAVVRGYAPEAQTIDYPLVEEPDAMTDRQATPDKPARPAVTHFRRLATVELPHAVGRYPTARYSLLSVEPETGRKHQIRRHMKHIFHPIVGDTTHGDGKHNTFFRQVMGSRRLLLASIGMEFPHPDTGQPFTLTAPLDQDFSRVLDALGWPSHLHDKVRAGEENHRGPATP